MITKKTDQSGATQLIRNGQPLNCPYQPAQLIPGNLAGQMQIIRIPCTSACPMFMESGSVVKIACNDVILTVSDDSKSDGNNNLIRL